MDVVLLSPPSFAGASHANGESDPKSVFQVHGVDAAGQMVVRRQLNLREVAAMMRNFDSKIHSARFDCCAFYILQLLRSDFCNKICQ
jgi:hypothetical protein